MIKSAVRTREERRAATLLEKAEDFALELNLNLDQKTKYIEIKQKSREKIDKVLEEAADKLHEIQKSEKDEIEKMLTVEQKAKFLAPDELSLDDEDDLLKVYRSKY